MTPAVPLGALGFRMAAPSPSETARQVGTESRRPPPDGSHVQGAGLALRALRRLLVLEVNYGRAMLKAVRDRRTITRTVYLVRPAWSEDTEEEAIQEDQERVRAAQDGRAWVEERAAEGDAILERIVRETDPIAPELFLPASLRRKMEARNAGTPPKRKRRRRRARKGRAA
jgi:hypothetical protein